MPILRAKIDPDLEAQLVARGRFEELERLKKAQAGTGFLGRFPEELGSKTIAAAKSIPGLKLGAYAISPLIIDETIKRQAETERRGIELQRAAAPKLRDPNLSKETKEKIKRMLEETDADILNDLPELSFTESQVAGEAISLSLLALSGFKPGLPGAASGKLVTGETLRALNQLKALTASMKAAERVARFGKAGKVINYAIAKGLPIGDSAIRGALGFGAAKAAGGGTKEEIIKHAKIGAGVGAALPAIIGIGVKAFSKISQTVGKKLIMPASRAIEEFLRKAAEGTDIDNLAAARLIESRISEEGGKRLIDLTELADDFFKTGRDLPDFLQVEIQDAAREAGYFAKLSGSETERTLQAIHAGDTFKQRAAKKALQGIESIKTLPQKLYDRFYPISRIQEMAKEAKGAPLSESEKVYRNFRLTQPTAEGRAEVMLKDFFDDFKQYEDIMPEVKARIVKLDLIDRARLGQKVALGQNLPELETGLQRLIAETGDDNSRILQAVDKWNAFNLKLLRERVDAGLISESLYKKLIETHPNYMPHNVILDIDEQIAEGFHLSGSLNVPKTDIKRAFGSLRQIDDPFVAMTQRTPVATQIIEKNKTLVGLVETQEKLNLIPEMSKISAGAEAEHTINLWRNGVKETWAVPADVEIAVKNLDYEPMSRLMRLISAPTRLLKKFATQYNISFTLPNLLRDRQTAALTADPFIKAIAANSDYVPTGATYSQAELYKLWKESGGGFASVFREGAPPKEIAAAMQKTGLWKILDEKINPVNLVDTLNQSIEESTRLTVFERAISQGLSPRDAAFVSREATIDFAKMGTFMRQLNQVVPFLNARVQGLINTFRAVAASPETFSRVMMWTAVYPTMILQNHNRQFESYENIPQYFKDQYWNIITGEVRTLDEDGKEIVVPQFVSIKKGEGQSLVANPLQHFLDKSDGLDRRTTTQMIADTVGNASPINFSTSYDRKHPLLSLLGSFGPLSTIPIGIATNIDPYSGYRVIPESRLKASPKFQYRNTTPEIIKEVAGAMNVSPSQIDFILRSFGGVPQDITALSDIAFKAGQGKSALPESLSKTPFGSAANLPLLRRFFREASGSRSPEAEFQKQKLEELEREEKDRSLIEREKLEDIYRAMNRLPTREEREEFLRLQNLNKNEIKMFKQIKRNRKSVEVLTPITDADVRAKYLLWRLDEMKAANIPLEERYAFLYQMEKEGILTSQVKKLMQKYK